MARLSIPASTATYTAGRGGNSVRFILVHYTGAAGTARNNGTYFSGGNRNASAHVFIDSDDVVYSVPLDSTAWHAGNFAMNQRSIGIEVCSAGEDFTDGEIQQLREVVMELMSAYGVSAENVIRHYDAYDFAQRAGIGGSWVDPRKHCPAPYVDHAKWHPLWAFITGTSDAYGDLTAQGGTTSPTALEVDGYWGEGTTRALQRHFNLVEDGEVSHQWAENVAANAALTSGWQLDETLEGSPTIRAIQARLGMPEGDRDGIIGANTIAYLQAHYGTVKDGVLDAASPCVMAMQRALNEGRF